jgi:Predicted membrane protein
VFVNAAMLTVFAISVAFPPTVIERFARSMEPDLPPDGVRYTRSVTLVWIAFFCCNGAAAIWTVLQPGWGAWLIYNGFIAYAAGGALFGGEYLVRHHIRKKAAK